MNPTSACAGRRPLSGLITVHSDLLATCRACRHVAQLEVLDVLRHGRSPHMQILELEQQLHCTKCHRRGTAVLDLVAREL